MQSLSSSLFCAVLQKLQSKHCPAVNIGDIWCSLLACVPCWLCVFCLFAGPLMCSQESTRCRDLNFHIISHLLWDTLKDYVSHAACGGDYELVLRREAFRFRLLLSRVPGPYVFCISCYRLKLFMQFSLGDRRWWLCVKYVLHFSISLAIYVKRPDRIWIRQTDLRPDELNSGCISCP